MYSLPKFLRLSFEKSNLKKSILINLINGFSHTILIITLIFISYILYIEFGLIEIFELLLNI